MRSKIPPHLSRTSKNTPPPPPAPPAPPPSPPSPEELLDMDAAIALLKTTRPTFYRWVRAGKLRGAKVGRQWRFRRGEVERFLHGQEPPIELAADITPLLETLRRRVAETGPAASPALALEHPVAQAAQLMVLLAFRLGASGLHLEPQPEGRAALRCRLDGALQPIATFDSKLLPALIRHWKGLAGCDVRDTARPQEGRLALHPPGAVKELDLRLTFLPAVLGEALHLRLLDPGSAHLDLDQATLAEPERLKLLRALEAPWGLVVLTGPAGSGKTSLLYACLNHLSARLPARQVLTVEDPVELLLPRALQVPVKTDAGLTIAGVLRTVLKADADVILVGEIRDLETLQLAQQSALTGHLVLTNLHAGEAVTALQRMIDVGSNALTVTEATRLVVGQRLVRQLCPNCSTPRPPETALLAQARDLARAAGIPWDSLPGTFRAPAGCRACHDTGYQGRRLLAEVLEMSPRLSAALLGRLGTADLRAIAISEGMIPLAAAGLRCAAEGQTALGEVLRMLSSLYH